MNTAKDNDLCFVFVITAVFFITFKNFQEAFRTKMRPKIKRLLLIPLEQGFLYKKKGVNYLLR